MGPVHFSFRKIASCIKRLFIIFFCFIFFYTEVLSQQTNYSFHDPIKPLDIGDQLDMQWIEPYLESPKSPLIILDFWSTWCTVCYKAFPKLDSFENKFGKDFQVILVNSKASGDDSLKIKNFFSKRLKKNGEAYQFTSIIGDTALTAIFPYRLFPHYVWIDSTGRVLAITSSEDVTYHNVAIAIQNKQISLPRKKDIFNYNAKQSLLHNNITGDLVQPAFNSMLTPRIAGIAKSRLWYKDSFSQRFTLINHNGIDLAQSAFSFPLSRYSIDSNLYHELKKAYYSYEIIAPLILSKEAIKNLMAQDLKRYLGITGHYKKQLIDCWVLQWSENADTSLILTRGRKPAIHRKTNDHPYTSFTNQSIENFTRTLNNSIFELNQKPIVVNETRIGFNIDLKLKSGLDNLQLLKSELKNYGFLLYKTQREIEIFTIERSSLFQKD